MLNSEQGRLKEIKSTSTRVLRELFCDENITHSCRYKCIFIFIPGLVVSFSQSQRNELRSSSFFLARVHLLANYEVLQLRSVRHYHYLTQDLAGTKAS